MIYIIGIYFLITILFSIFKKNNTFKSFSNGVNDGIKIVLNMFKILLVFTFSITCLENSGLITFLTIKTNNSAFIMILIQMIIRPISNGSSYALLMNIYDTYGINSFYGYLSTFIHSTCDTMFYIITIYSSYSKIKLTKKIFLLGFSIILFTYILIFIICFIFFK